jgi:hypothetical protein
MRIYAAPSRMTGLTEIQSVFLDAWCSLTHPQSPEYRRARTLNARLALKEFVEVADSVLRGPVSSLHRAEAGKEAAEVLRSDPILSDPRWKRWSGLPSMLSNRQEFTGEKAGKAHILTALARRAADELDGTYRAHLLSKLMSVVSGDAHDRAARGLLHRVCNALAADLLADDYSTRDLTAFLNLFSDEEERSGRSFTERMRYFQELVERKPTSFEVRAPLQVHAAARAKLIGRREAEWRIHEEPPDSSRPRMGRPVIAVREGVQARDAKHAGKIAARSLEEVFDIVGLEVGSLGRLTSSMTVSSAAGTEAVKLDPQYEWDPAPLTGICADENIAVGLDAILRTSVSSEQTHRFARALRFSRLGTDQLNEETRFLTRWIGLEILLRGDGTADTVARRAGAVMKSIYLARRVASVARLLRYIGSSEATTSEGQPSAVAPVTPSELMRVLESDVQIEPIVAQLRTARPFVADEIDDLRKLAAEPSALAERVAAHERSVYRQVLRASRLRNQLVHAGHNSPAMNSLTGHIDSYLRCALLLIGTLSRDTASWTSIDEVLDYLTGRSMADCSDCLYDPVGLGLNDWTAMFAGEAPAQQD